VSPTTSHDLRCPQCSAQTSPGADWCTLCFADLRPKELREAPAAPPAVEAVPETEPEVDAAKPAARGNGKHARAATTYDDAALTAVPAATPRDPSEKAEIEARADEMLAMLAAANRNSLGPVAERLSTAHSRIVAGLIGLVGVSLLGWLVMTVLGHLV
jgi:hypothetical protein